MPKIDKPNIKRNNKTSTKSNNKPNNKLNNKTNTEPNNKEAPYTLYPEQVVLITTKKRKEYNNEDNRVIKRLKALLA